MVNPQEHGRRDRTGALWEYMLKCSSVQCAPTPEFIRFQKIRDHYNVANAMGRPIPPPHQPIQTDNYLASPQHQLYPCHIYICTQRHSLWAGRKIPNTHLLLSSSSHQVSSSRGKEAVAPAWPAHLPGSVEWSYVDIRNLGSNVYPWGPTVPLPLVNGWVHHPTVNYFSFEDAWTMQ